MRHTCERATGDVRRVVNEEWATLHWNTITAACRRGGVYAAGGRRLDLAAEIARPIIDGVTVAWVEFFGRSLGEGIDSARTALLDAVERFLCQLAINVRSAGTGTALREEGEALRERTRRIVEARVSEIHRDMREQLDADRRAAHEFVMDQIRSEMAPAFGQAAEETGTGRKRRMLEILDRHALRLADTMAADLSSQLGEQLHGITDRLHVEFGRMSNEADVQTTHLCDAVGSRAAMEHS